MNQSMPVEVSPISGGRGRPFGCPDFDVAAYGYDLTEYRVAGTAASYRMADGAAPPIDGWWETDLGPEAGYSVRVIVIRPSNPARFNGVLLVNWQNVTAGVDLGSPSRRDLERGYSWVGVTAQRIGVEGFPGIPDVVPRTPSLAEWDPERYRQLHHPGDAYSYDIYAQLGRWLRSTTTDAAHPLADLELRVVLATGSSQSAMRLGSYVNVAHRRDLVFDGFFLHLHWGVCPGLPDQDLWASLAPTGDGRFHGSSAIRDDGSVPILVLCSESEFAHNLPVHQPDSATFRFWEVAGASHVDADVAASMTTVFARDGLPVRVRESEANSILWGYVRDAAVQRLVDWVDSGNPPTSIPPIEVDPATGPPDGPSARPTARRDQFGNAIGGVRLPELEAPTATHRGTGVDASDRLAALAGHTAALPLSVIESRSANAGAYINAWSDAVDQLAAVGLVLDEDLDLLRERGRTIAAKIFG